MKKISERLYVGLQRTADDIRQAKAKGFAAIINNRPDGEEPGQTLPSKIARSPKGSSLATAIFRSPRDRSQRARFGRSKEARSQSASPVPAHCRTGTGSATVYAIGEVLEGRMGKDQAIPFGQRIGLDLSGAVKWLDAHGR